MRILQIIQKKQYRGAEIFACQLSNHLLDQGHSVEVYSIYDGSAHLPFKAGVKTLKRNSGKRYYDLTGWRDLADIVKNFRPDIVQANAADTLKYAVISRILFGWESPIIFRNASASSFYIKTWSSKMMNSFLLKQTDLIISVSEASKRDLNKMFPFTELKSFVVPVGIETKDEPKGAVFAHFDRKKNNLIHVGSFTHEKNHLELLDLFVKIKDYLPSAVLHLLGDGPLREFTQERVKRMDLEDHVIFHKEKKNPIPLVREADVLLLPSIIEGLPAVLLEAMYNKIPVVAYDVGGVSEVLEGYGKNLIPFREQEKFVQSVVDLCRNPDQIQVEAGYQRVLTGYSNKKIAQRFLFLYSKASARTGV